MSAEVRYFRLGLFVLVALAAGAGSVAVLGAGTLFRKKILVETYVDESVQGLDTGAPVKYRGVHVGQLEHVGFAGVRYGARDNRIRLVMAFFPDRLRGIATDDPRGAVRNIAEEGMRVRLASQGLTGGVYLELDFMEPREHPPAAVSWAPEYPYLPSVPSTGVRLTQHIENVLESVEKVRFDRIAEKVMATLESIDKVAASLGPVTASVRTTADEAVALVKDVRKTLADDLGKDIRGLLAQIKELIEKDVAPAVRGATAASDRLPATFDRLEATLDRVGAAMIRAERLAREERGPLDETLENLRGLTADLRDVTGQLRKYPSQVLLGDPPPRSKVVDK